LEDPVSVAVLEMVGMVGMELSA